MQKIVIRTLSLSLLILGASICTIGCGKNNAPASANEPVPTTTTSVVVNAPVRPDEVSCPNCKGIGRYNTCPQCADKDSTGKRACTHCEGTGTLKCGYCNGQRTVPQDAVPGISAKMELERMGIEKEQREKERREKEEREQAMYAMELATRRAEAKADAEARIAEAQAAAEREKIAIAERERERQREQQRIVAEQRARVARERQQLIDERKAKWSQLYNMIEEGMDSDRVVALAKEGLDENDTKLLGASTVMSKARLNRDGKLEWQSRDERLSITVLLRKGEVSSKGKKGF